MGHIVTVFIFYLAYLAMQLYRNMVVEAINPPRPSSQKWPPRNRDTLNMWGYSLTFVVIFPPKASRISLLPKYLGTGVIFENG